MTITKTELHYDFTITTKPGITTGTWVGHGVVHYVDEDLAFEFGAHRWGRQGEFSFEPGGDPAVEARVEADLLRVLAECYDFAVEQAEQRFGHAAPTLAPVFTRPIFHGHGAVSIVIPDAGVCRNASSGTSGRAAAPAPATSPWTE